MILLEESSGMYPEYDHPFETISIDDLVHGFPPPVGAVSPLLLFVDVAVSTVIQLQVLLLRVQNLHAWPTGK